MPEIWEKAKAHPYMTAGIIFGIGIVVILIYKSLHSTPVNTGASDYAAYQAAAAQEAASGNQLAGLQAQLQAAGNQINAEQAIASSHDAAQVQLAQIAADTAKNQAELEAQVAQAQSVASVQVAGIGADASVAQSSIAASVNNNNNAAALYSQLLGEIGSHLTPSSVGQVLSTNFNFGGVSAGSFSSAENIPTYNGMPVFVTSPTGQVFNYAYGSPTANNIYLGTDPGNYSYGYQYHPMGTTPPTIH